MFYVLGVAVSSFLSFAVIIYGYITLYNKFFNRTSLRNFLIIVLLLFVATAALRMIIEKNIIGPLTDKGTIFTFGNVHITYTLVSCFFALIIGVLSKSYVEAMYLRTRQAEIQKKHLEAELNHLKAQVQPHFLFNSLNNLYYDTYKILPDVAGRIAKLSEIMRYFMEESPKQKVPLLTEVEFIESYIELETVRIHSPITIQWQREVNLNVLVPPMLLIPLVENVFKHGIQSNGTSNYCEINLFSKSNRLYFVVKNPLRKATTTEKRNGTGLQNLRDRLQLLYKDQYTLHCKCEDGFFIAELSIPVYEA